MTKSELIEKMAAMQDQLSQKDIEFAVKLIVDTLAQQMVDGGRIEIRGFGSFSVHYRPPRQGRNPRTGAVIDLKGKKIPHFKPGKDLRERINKTTGVIPTR